MPQIENLTQASQAIGQFVFGPLAASLPEQLKTELTAVSTKPGAVQNVVGFTETVYANRSEFTQDGLAIAAELAMFCTINGWFHFRDERGPLVCDTFKRDAGQKKPGSGKWHTSEKDPDNAPGTFVLSPSTDPELLGPEEPPQ